MISAPKCAFRCRILAAALAASFAVQATSVPSIAAEDKGKDTKFLEKMQQWQDRMSDKFRDTWKGLRGQGRSGASASVDLREQEDSYVVRLNLPERDLQKVNIRVEEGALRIVAPAEGKQGKYEQTIELAGLAAGQQPKIDRRQNDSIIVVTLPKGDSVPKSKPSDTLPDPSLLPLNDWDRDIFARMENMRREMNKIFDESFREFRLAPEHKGFFDEPRFGSTVDLKEEGDNYVVRAYLPDRDMQNINVNVQGQTLRIEAKQEDSTNKSAESGEVRRTRKAAYSQVLTLPGPVEVEKMKVDKKDAMLVVTLPKAK